MSIVIWCKDDTIYYTLVGVEASVKGEIIDVEAFVVDLRVLVMIVRRLVVRN